MRAGPQIQTIWPFVFFSETAFIPMFQSVGVAAGAWLLAIYDRQSWKKVKSTKSLFFLKMARGGKWPRVAADGCNQLQLVAATCSHLPKQPLASTRRHLPRGAAASACQVAAKWLLEQVAAKWLQVVVFSKIKMMHVCSLSVSFFSRLRFPKWKP